MTDTDHQRLPDIWYTLDYRVLLEAARWEVTGCAGGSLEVEDIAQRIGEPVERVLGALVRLHDGEYIEIVTLRGGSRLMHAVVKAVRPTGLREAGPWPKTDDLAATLREVLEAQVKLLERRDPERAGKARRALAALLDTGTDFTAKLAAELIKAYLPLPTTGP